MSCEITVKIKEKEKTFTLKQMCYNDDVVASTDDKHVQEVVAKAEKNFGGDPIRRKVTVTIKLLD